MRILAPNFFSLWLTLRATCIPAQSVYSHEESWSAIWNKNYTVLEGMKRLCWVFTVSYDFELYTDNKNVIFIFDALTIKTGIEVGTPYKVLRWAAGMTTNSITTFTNIFLKIVINEKISSHADVFTIPAPYFRNYLTFRLFMDLFGLHSSPANVARQKLCL